MSKFAGNDIAVIDDQLIREALLLDGNGSKKDNEEKQFELEKVELLRLSFKKLIKINNLIGFDNLIKLQLDNNNIEKIENLGHLIHLEWLDLSFNKIKKIEGLEKLVKLTDLSLTRNEITTLENMEQLTNLTVLSIGYNKLADIEKLIYLRQFQDLAVLNLVGNPVSSMPEYRPYVMARIRNIRYLDHRIVDENSLRIAREQYQDELRDILAKEKEEEEHLQVKQEKAARRKELEEANLQNVDTMYEDIVREDTEMPKLKGLRVLRETFIEYGDKMNEMTSTFIVQMLENHQLKRREKEQFNLAFDKIKKGNDEKCTKLIEDFQSKKKRVMRSISSNQIEAEAAFESLRVDIDVLFDQLMDLETQLVEQYEEFIREFEVKMGEMTSSNLETIQTFFTKVRDGLATFHDKLSTISLQELSKFNKNEVEYEATDEEKLLFADKEALTNIINASLDLQSLQIESREDDLTKFESRWLEQTVNQVKNTENKRNTDRVFEISNFIKYSLSQLTLKEL